MSNQQIVDTVIIGGGQCGLAVGYFLKQESASFVILDDNQQVGDGWRRRYDSLRLYTPACYDGLPGMDFPASDDEFPSGRQMGDFLDAYAAKFELPVRHGERVDSVQQARDHGFVVTTSAGTYQCANVVVATGSQQTPQVPAIAGQLDPDIRQFHSDDYRNSAQLREGSVLVVGASHSGADIAMECAANHSTVLAGPIRGELPLELEGKRARRIRPVLWFMANHVMTLRTPLGRKMKDEVRSHGGPLLRYKSSHLEAAGVRHVENRVTDVKDGKPMLDDGTVLDPANVVWCTGFGRDFNWLNVPYELEDGWPKQARGVVEEVPGLFFSGLIFQYAFSSMLIGGAARDAKHVASAVLKRETDRAAGVAQAA
jgi:putative flavoprotein involved in K+ transport